jgi:hypothetical protein
MTLSELKSILADANAREYCPDLPPCFGNLMVGIWACSASGCSLPRLVPRQLRIALPEASGPLCCPLCDAPLIYDEEG